MHIFKVKTFNMALVQRHQVNLMLSKFPAIYDGENFER